MTFENARTVDTMSNSSSASGSVANIELDLQRLVFYKERSISTELTNDRSFWK